MNPFETWLAENGYDVEAVNANAKQKKHLEAAWRTETAPPPEVTDKPKEKAGDGGSFDEQMEAIEKESKRIQAIQELTAKAATGATRDPDKVKRIREIGEAAVKDSKCDINSFRLTMLREERNVGPMVLTPTAPQVNGDILEAAICVSQRLPGVEKIYPAQTLEAAHKQFKRGIGLNELLLMAAERNGGYRGSARDMPAIIRHAKYTDDMHAGAWGPSTINTPASCRTSPTSSCSSASTPWTTRGVRSPRRAACRTSSRSRPTD
jgi:hypothetical protein